MSVKVRNSYNILDQERGPIEEHIEQVSIDMLMDVHLDYTLARFMPFHIVDLVHIAGLRPAWVTVEREDEKLMWSPCNNEEHAKEALRHLDALPVQEHDRKALEIALKKHLDRDTIEIPILKQPGIDSPYSDCS